VWRYGLKSAPFVMAPPLLAVLLTPALRAWFGGSFTFFDGMALVLVLSIGVDYSIFLAETSPRRQSVTMLAVVMAAATALLSFGLLAFSSVQAVHTFGSTMLIGILLAFLLSPLARAAYPRVESVR
jgi:predicted exporter